MAAALRRSHGVNRKRLRAPTDGGVKKKIATKFAECNQCIFYCARRQNPICDDCDAGEHFEERIRGLNPARDNKFGGYGGDEE